MSTKNAMVLIVRNGLIGLMALALLVVWYCLVTPQHLSQHERSRTFLFIVLVLSFSSSFLITARSFESRTWKRYVIAISIGLGVISVIFVAFMLILLNMVGS